jgi:hypothetical protein
MDHSEGAMGWSIGYDINWERDIGYGVPAYCDYPGCGREIDRGLSYVCGGKPYGGDEGCGLFFCGGHVTAIARLCERCEKGSGPFVPTPDHSRWLHHKLTDPSWSAWRDSHADEVAFLRARKAVQ